MLGKLDAGTSVGGQLRGCTFGWKCFRIIDGEILEKVKIFKGHVRNIQIYMLWDKHQYLQSSLHLMGWLIKFCLGRNCSWCFVLYNQIVSIVPYTRWMFSSCFSKCGEQIVKWRSWRLPVARASGSFFSTRFCFLRTPSLQEAHKSFHTPRTRTIPKIALEESTIRPPAYFHPTHTPTISTQHQRGKTQAPLKQCKHPQPPTPSKKPVNILRSYGLSSGGPRPKPINVVVIYGSPPPRK